MHRPGGGAIQRTPGSPPVWRTRHEPAKAEDGYARRHCGSSPVWRMRHEPPTGCADPVILAHAGACRVMPGHVPGARKTPAPMFALRRSPAASARDDTAYPLFRQIALLNFRFGPFCCLRTTRPRGVHAAFASHPLTNIAAIYVILSYISYEAATWG